MGLIFTSAKEDMLSVLFCLPVSRIMGKTPGPLFMMSEAWVKGIGIYVKNEMDLMQKLCFNYGESCWD